jgi:hypothetical protein
MIEIHNTVFDCEQGIVTPAFHVQPGVDLRSALADEDIPDDNMFTTELLNAKPLRMTIPSVSA